MTSILIDQAGWIRLLRIVIVLNAVFLPETTTPLGGNTLAALQAAGEPSWGRLNTPRLALVTAKSPQVNTLPYVKPLQQFAAKWTS